MGLLLAVAVFAGVVALVGAVRAGDEDPIALADAARRAPDPSPRDVHAVTGTLGRAPVPSWG